MRSIRLQITYMPYAYTLICIITTQSIPGAHKKLVKDNSYSETICDLSWASCHSLYPCTSACNGINKTPLDFIMIMASV